MARKVTMVEFYKLKDVSQQALQASEEAQRLATDGSQITLKAEDEGNKEWALRFSQETAENLTKLYAKLATDCENAAEAFTGEKRWPFETFQSYWFRIGEALLDVGKLHTMMKRNGVTLVNE